MPGLSELLQSGSLAYSSPSPASVAARRALAEQLLKGSQIQNAGPLGALANALGGSFSGYENKQATNDERLGMESASTAYADALKGDKSFQDLAGVAGNQWLNPGQSGVVNALLGKEIGKMYPAPAEPYTLGEGQQRFSGDNTLLASGPPSEPDTLVTTNVGGTDKFYDSLDAKLGEQTAALIDSGLNAQSNNIRLQQVGQLLESAPQGMGGVMTQALGSLGIPTEGLDEVQAAQALINQMVPGQRPPGSGTMSDADLALFKASLPAIVNQPGGNALIIQTAQAINDYTIAQAEIAQRVANREISPAEGRAEQAAIPNPLDGITQAVGALDDQAEDGPIALSPENADAEYDSLPSGTQFLAPDGTVRVKP